MSEAINPANEVATSATPRPRESFNSRELKLQVDPIEGYHLHWFRGEPGRIQRAQRVGYEFVRPEEINVVNFDLAGDITKDGNSDLGERVSVPAQDSVGEDGQFLRLYLMKLKEEFWKEDQAKYVAEMIDPVVVSLKAGMIGAGDHGESPADLANRTRRPQKLPEMFTKKSNA